MNTDGDRLKKLRKVLDIKQGDFAKKISTTQGHISDIENGRKSLSERTIKLICLEDWDGQIVNEDWLRTGAGGDDNMFIKLSEDEELAMYTQMLLDSTTDDVIANMIKKFICIYEKLDADSKKVLMNIADELIDKQKKE